MGIHWGQQNYQIWVIWEFLPCERGKSHKEPRSCDSCPIKHINGIFWVVFEDLPEKAQDDDGDNEGYKRHSVTNGVSNSHRAQEFTLWEKKCEW